MALSNQPIENPLLRSGLALAGVNQKLGRADQGEGRRPDSLRSSGLDLWGTKLVVLSACDTGVGEVKRRRGVRAEAGAVAGRIGRGGESVAGL